MYVYISGVPPSWGVPGGAEPSGLRDVPRPPGAKSGYSGACFNADEPTKPGDEMREKRPRHGTTRESAPVPRLPRRASPCHLADVGSHLRLGELNSMCMHDRYYITYNMHTII